ncbi:response regulator [Novosphingobium sp. JCM 18896]|uniref:response regulator n=1 Tax=Novosphingobium sp. JCM 18896 TaxID=2989731 RepID=UPI00222328CA|nr:response regulator [Novosphingobium sp. JCM 18896]MCW1430205.1 response regulator [Novosphingobium sp. JCM 18896]
MLVDDEEDIRYIVKIALESSDAFDITAFASGANALEHLARKPNLYDLALINFRLPGMHGIDFLRQARRMAGYERLPAIIISAARERASSTLTA